jgi:cobalt-zinc-cadmium efflux system protein
MLVGMLLNGVFVAVELGVGLLVGSLALVADAGHNAGDVVGLGLAWGAAALARRPATVRFTWGFRRATILAALANASLLLVACGGILIEAARRLRQPDPVEGMTVTAVAAIGMLINTATAAMLHRGSASDLNLRAAFLHMVADAAISAGVVGSGVLIHLTGWQAADPLCGIAIAIAIAAGAWGLLRESLSLAMDAVPRGIDPIALRASLAAIEGVAAVGALHVWGPSTFEASGTVRLAVPRPADAERVVGEATRVFREGFGVSHTTVQVDRRDGYDVGVEPACERSPDATR